MRLMRRSTSPSASVPVADRKTMRTATDFFPAPACSPRYRSMRLTDSTSLPPAVRIAFSTSPQVRRAFDGERRQTDELANDQTSAVFQAAVDAVEESVYNSLLMATSETGNGVTVQAIPLDRVREVLRKYNVGRR